MTRDLKVTASLWHQNVAVHIISYLYMFQTICVFGPYAHGLDHLRIFQKYSYGRTIRVWLAIRVRSSMFFSLKIV